MAGLDTATLDRLVGQAVSISRDHVAAGGIPFSAIVADRRGTVLGTGFNQVVKDCDPTAHAEVVALRNACSHHHMTNLRGHVLICSGEPCAMCYIAALWAGVSDVVYAVSSAEAAQAGFDYTASYQFLAGWPGQWPIRIYQHRVDGALAPFHDYGRPR